ncbi:MAG TPA: PsbP-related protein [Elusimicrobiota bacterium]|nr:PsbP-related protein [Elusimicrobiota bacterium]
MPRTNKFSRFLPVVGLALVVGFACGKSESRFKTYKNTKYHYTIDYPSAWAAQGTAPDIAESVEITFFKVNERVGAVKGLTLITVHVYDNPRARPPEQWYAQDAAKESDGLYPYPAKIVASAETTTVNGHPAYRVGTTDEAESFDYFVGAGTAIYRLSFEKFAGDEATPKELFERSLKSFRISQ